MSEDEAIDKDHIEKGSLYVVNGCPSRQSKNW